MVVAKTVGIYPGMVKYHLTDVPYDRIVYMLVIKGTISREIGTFASPVIIQPSITHTSGAVFAEV